MNEKQIEIYAYSAGIYRKEPEKGPSEIKHEMDEKKCCTKKWNNDNVIIICKWPEGVEQ